jgi:hypothetical protein
MEITPLSVEFIERIRSALTTAHEIPVFGQVDVQRRTSVRKERAKVCLFEVAGKPISPSY